MSTAATVPVVTAPAAGPVPEFIVPDLLQQAPSNPMPFYPQAPYQYAIADPDAIYYEGNYYQGEVNPGVYDSNAYYQTNDQAPVLFNDPPEPQPFSWG